MKHTSVPISPIEIIEMEDSAFSPLISKVQIKVCYVGDEPNRNRSIITKEVAKEMAPSLRGNPIVGFYSEAKEDFEEHNRSIEISNGEFKVKDTTRPYGFVDLNANVWFQTFLDDDEVEREYLVTEGYIWTSQYPESQRIIDKGNNQSMELDEKTLDAFWTKDNNGKPQFFIINEAITSKLCILGDNCEPCFEGSQITAFSLADDFEERIFAMMNELKEILKEGGAKEVLTTYAVEIGDALWCALWDYVGKTYPNTRDYCSVYTIEGVYEEGEQKFAVLQHRENRKYFRLNFELSDANGFVPSETLIEVTKSYTPAAEPQFALDAVEEFETEYKKKKVEEEDKKDKEESDDSEDKSEEDKCPECGKPLDECECDKKKKKYNLDEVAEYAELVEKYEALTAELEALKNDYAALETENNNLKAENAPLKEFKLSAEKKEKQAMIDQFYMLSDEDKADVMTNIDTYSVDDIEAKLSIICVRNKVSFDLDENKGNKGPVTYSLTDDDEDIAVPAWVKSLRETAKSM